MYKNYIKEYFDEFKNVYHDTINKNKKFISYLEKKFLKVRKKNKSIFIFGNGGSAAIASHFAIDLAKNLNVKAIAMTNSELITCFSNDFGHDKWMKEACKKYVTKNDLVIAISSSGNSANHINLAKFCKRKQIEILAITGFNKNKLHTLCFAGLVVNSKNYNIIENIHSTIILSIIDKLSNKKIN
jgi:D-sedoheptulose 7-phosphate isomerase